MGKKRDRDDEQKERLEALVREQKKQIRQLEKRVKKLARGYRKFLDEDPLDDEPEVILEDKKECWDCGKGVLEAFIVFNRRWRCCNLCGKRTRVKIME